MRETPLTQQTPDDWFDGTAVPSASFNGPAPITWAGQITAPPELIQKRDFDDGTPLFWPDGRPKQLLQVNIQTDQRDPSIPDDDGKRALYLEFRKKDAVQEAIKAAGQKGAPKQGGWLSLTYTGDDHAAKKGKNAPPKMYTAQYKAPDPWAEQPAPPQQGGWGQIPPQQQGPPQQYQQQAMPGPSAPAAGDPLAEFLEMRNLSIAALGNRETALLVARQQGYQGQ